MVLKDNFSENSPRIYRLSTTSVQKNLRIIEIGYNRVPKNLSQFSKREVYILHYVINGKGVFCGKEFAEGFCYTVFPSSLETITADKENPYESYWIMFEGSHAGEILKKCNLGNHNDAFAFEGTARCAEILRNTLFNIKPLNEIEEAYLMQAAFYQIIAEHFKKHTDNYSVDTKAEKVKEFINQNYQKGITVNNISKSFNFSRNYLFMLFKKEFNTSPQNYILNVRIERAKELLTDKEQLPINQIAFAVGYNDPLYFSRVFSKKTGLSPKEYRKQNIKH